MLFRSGYDDDGNKFPIDVKKLFRVIISDITVDSSSSGSVYTITGVTDGTIGPSNEFTTPSQHTQIDNVATFGEFWDRFKKTMNEQSKKLDYNNLSKRVEYDFVFPTEWRSWQFKRKPTDNPSSSGFDYVDGTGKANINISRGTSIDTILKVVMSMTDEGKKFTLGQSAAGKDGGVATSRAESEGIALMPIIESKVEFTAYNYLYQDYVRKVTYYFKPYPTVRSYKDRAFINNKIGRAHV